LQRPNPSSGLPLTFPAVSQWPSGTLSWWSSGGPWPSRVWWRPISPRIEVFVDRRHGKNLLAQMTKPTFFKHWFLTVKYCQNTVKNCLVEEKERGNTEKKNQGETRYVFKQFFVKVSVFTMLTIYSYLSPWTVDVQITLLHSI
jgi:hypothetical protein